MTLRYKAHPTVYRHTRFRSRLEARWAAWFDLNKIKWQYEPIDLVEWVPDFIIYFPYCPTRGPVCGMPRSLVVEVKPATSIEMLLQIIQPHLKDIIYDPNIDPAPAAFGINPSISYYHAGSCNSEGSAFQSLDEHQCGISMDWEDTWAQAGNTVQWRKA